jgi:D-alanyl-lipoteichoic acid acyltransferase DltB (MBOAT superfamily)
LRAIFFYSAWNPPFVILLWVSTVIDWYAAQGLVRARRESARHAWMLLSVIANLGMLGYFKYGQFLLDNFTTLMSALGIDYHPAHYDIVLPVGISFYTFATMSYTLDVDLRRAVPARNLLDYALFVGGALLAASGAPGIHFEDYPELQGYQLPDWSHMTHSEAERFTAALYGVVMRDSGGAGPTRRPQSVTTATPEIGHCEPDDVAWPRGRRRGRRIS